MAEEQLVLRLDAEELLLSRVLGVGTDVQILVQEVAQAIDPAAKFQLAVDTISRNSPALLELRPVPSERHRPHLNVDDLVGTIGNGLAQLEETGDRPIYFSDRALEKIRELSNYRDFTLLTLGMKGYPVEFGAELRGKIDRILGPTVSSWGTVEGRLESMSVHSNRSFNIYDLLTNQRIICYFGRRISAEKVGSAVERRVSVYGEIRYRQSGTILSILAEDLDVLPREDELPPPETARGVLREVRGG